MTADVRIPANVLTGFLGSGKTTLLRRILRDPAFSGSAVLINEFGAVGLDHELVGAVEGAPVLLSSGCICCTIRGDLSQSIRDLHAARQRGDIPAFTRLVIETTGLADPTPILATITADLVIRHHFRTANVIATIDAIHAARGLDSYPELEKQAAVADCLVITKTDLAAPGAVAMLRERLGALNPAAAIHEAVLSAVDPGFVLQRDIHGPRERLAEARHWLASGAGAAATHTAGITSFCIRRDPPLDWTRLGVWFSLMVHRHGARLLRVKGILNVAGSETPVALHSVQHVIHTPEHLPGWPTNERASRLVFITGGLDAARVEASFTAFLDDAKSRDPAGDIAKWSRHELCNL